MSKKTYSIAISWSGLPPYAVSCLRRLYDKLPSRCQLTVISTVADVPHKNIEARLGLPVIWLNPDKNYTWFDLGLSVPDVYFQGGWAKQAFTGLGSEVSKTRGKRIILIDNDWSGSFRQIISGLYFRILNSGKYSGAFVPGESSRRFARWLGFRKGEIRMGLYGADSETFQRGFSLSERPRRFLFVGRLINRKGIPELLKAIEKIGSQLNGWEIHIMGAGAFSGQCKEKSFTRLLPFGTPEEVAKEMAESRFFILPSRKEHWGVVVHEAALSGCGLILSEGVGARLDLADRENAFFHKIGDVDSLAEAILKALSVGNEELDQMGKSSYKKANDFGPEAFTESFMYLAGIYPESVK